MDRKPGSSRVYEVPISGPFDEDVANAAEVVGFHLSGSKPPIVLIRTWENEVEHQRRLARSLGSDQPLYSVAPPSGEEIQDFPETVDEWSDRCLERLCAVPGGRPHRLGGWSFGGVIAVEMAEKLRARGEAVEILLLLDTRIPTYHARPRRGQRASQLHKLSRRLNEYVELRTREERQAYLRKRGARWLQKTGKKLRRGARREKKEQKQQIAAAYQDGKFTTSTTGRVMGYLERAVRVAYVKYEKHPVSVPIAQFWTQESLQEEGGDATLGWGWQARGPLETIGIPGTHWGMWQEESVRVLAARLERALRRLEAQPKGAVEEAGAAPAETERRLSAHGA